MRLLGLVGDMKVVVARAGRNLRQVEACLDGLVERLYRLEAGAKLDDVEIVVVIMLLVQSLVCAPLLRE